MPVGKQRPIAKGRKTTRMVNRWKEYWECDKCNRDLGNETAYRLHMRVRHPGAKVETNITIGSSFLCGTCGYELPKSGQCLKGCRRW